MKERCYNSHLLQLVNLSVILQEKQFQSASTTTT